MESLTSNVTSSSYKVKIDAEWFMRWALEVSHIFPESEANVDTC